MEAVQSTLYLPSGHLHAHLEPDGEGWEWRITEYNHGSRRWDVLDSGAHSTFAGACQEVSMAFSWLAEPGGF